MKHGAPSQVEIRMWRRACRYGLWNILLPNLGGTGDVLRVSATGGSATNVAADFLDDAHSHSKLRRHCPPPGTGLSRRSKPW